MSANVAWVLLACLACGSSPKKNDAAVREDADSRAAYARGSWEAAKNVERVASSRFKSGIGTHEEHAAAVESRLRAERELALRDLDVEEITATGAAPVRHLAAPVVGDQDFVLRWLEIEETYTQRIEESARSRHGLALGQYNVSLLPFDKVLPLDEAAAVARVDHQRWRDLVALRRRITADAIDPPDAYNRAAEADYAADLKIARIRVRTARRMLKLVQGHYKAGLRTDADVAAAESELARLQNAEHEALMGRGRSVSE